MLVNVFGNRESCNKAYGKLFKAMSKHMPANIPTFSIYSSNQSEQQQQQPPSPMQWGNPDTIQRLLVNGSSDEILKDIHFERRSCENTSLEPQSLLGKE